MEERGEGSYASLDSVQRAEKAAVQRYPHMSMGVNDAICADGGLRGERDRGVVKTKVQAESFHGGFMVTTLIEPADSE
jgi:hypothetical protein